MKKLWLISVMLFTLGFGRMNVAAQDISTGKVVDEAQMNEPEQKEVNPWKNMLFLSVAGGLIIAIIYTAMLNSKMKNVKKQKDAFGYMQKDSYELTKKQDVFLYSQVTKKEIPCEDPGKSNSNLGSSHDRTTTHISRGGRKHGGKF